MDNYSSKKTEQVNEKDSKQLFVKLFQVLSEGGITILDEHAELVSHESRFTATNPDGSAEAQGDSQDKSSISISGANHNKKMDFLHIAGDYVNSKGTLGKTPLHLSAETGDTELVDIFITAGANVKAEDKDKQTPLHLSARNGHKEVVDALLKAGANVEAEDKDKQTPLHLSAGNGHKEVVDTLLKAGAYVDANDNDKQTPLHLSAGNGHKEVVDALLKAGANVESEDEYELTPLHISAWNGHKEVVDILLKAGAYVEANNNDKQTPLLLSAWNGHKEVVDALLKAGAYVESEDEYEQTPLHISAWNDHKEVVDILIKAGANIEAEDILKLTPLHISVSLKNYDVTELLLSAGASVKTRDIRGRTCLDYMDDRQRLRFGFEPRKLLKLRNWMDSKTNSKKHVQNSTSTKTTTEHTKTKRAKFTDLNSGTFPCQGIRTIHNEESSNNNGQDEMTRHMSTLPSSEPSFRRSSETPVGPQSLCSHSSLAESQVLDDKDLQEMCSIKPQAENHWPKTTEGCKTSCSHNVKATVQDGRIVIPTTINITQNRNIKKIKKVKHYYEPGTSFNISHAQNVALGSQTVIHSTRKISEDDDIDDSSSEEESDN